MRLFAQFFRRRRVLVASSVVVALAVAFVARVAWHAYRAEGESFARAPLSDVVRHPEQAGVAGLEEVSFTAPPATRIAGWYVRPAEAAHGAAVIVLHGSNADRGSMIDEVRGLAGAGLGVLAYDSPGCGASDGQSRWGRGERDALGAAIAWLSARPSAEVDDRRLGALGFSYGGYVLAQVAAEDDRLRAVVLEAAPSDAVEQARWEFRRWGPLSGIPAVWALERGGMPVHEDRPIDLVARIAPRPLLVVGGTDDGTVSPQMVRALYEAARDPKELWMVPGATHGLYARAAPVEYPARVVAFFARALAN